MAKLKCINHRGKYVDPEAKEDVIRYILDQSRTVPAFCGGYLVDPISPVESMENISKMYGKDTGVQLRHFVVSFSPDELSQPETALKIAAESACYIAQEFQCIFAVHLNRPHLHFHLVWNSCSYVDGHRYRGTRQEFYAMKNTFNTILRKYGISRLDYVSSIGKE